MDSVYQKIRTLPELSERLSKKGRAGKKVVHCHGVFDLLHLGHIRHLHAAKKHGDILVVTTTADQYVKRGPGRPVFSQDLRLEAIANMEIVDFVAVVEGPVATDAIKAIQPDFYVKGADYRKRESDVTQKIYDEEAAVREVGGELIFTDELTFSSSQLINNYFDSYPRDTLNYLKKIATCYSADYIGEQLKRLSDLKVLVIGDTIIDQYHYCRPLNKSSKENIVVNKYINGEDFAGGALATCNHAAQVASDIELLTVLGKDDSYEDFVRRHLNTAIQPQFFYRDNCVTTVKRRYVHHETGQKLFEVCFMDDQELISVEQQGIIDYLKSNLPKYDLVIVSDFGHGMLTNDIIEVLCREARCLAVNVQTNSANLGFNFVTKYRRADLVCIDEREIRLAMHDKQSDLESLVKKIHRQLSCQQVMVTRGPDGAISFRKEGFDSAPALAQTSVDKVGAGDAFFSYVAPCFAIGLPQDLTNFVGNAVGAIAVQIVGNRESVQYVDLMKYITRLLKL